MITIFKAIYKSVNSRQKSPLEIVFLLTHNNHTYFWNRMTISVCVWCTTSTSERLLCSPFQYLSMSSPVENILKPFRYNELFVSVRNPSHSSTSAALLHPSATFSPLCLFWTSSNQCSIILEVHQSHRTCGFVFLLRLMYFSGSSMSLMIWSIFFLL